MLTITQPFPIVKASAGGLASIALGFIGSVSLLTALINRPIPSIPAEAPTSITSPKENAATPKTDSQTVTPNAPSSTPVWIPTARSSSSAPATSTTIPVAPSTPASPVLAPTNTAAPTEPALTQPTVPDTTVQPVITEPTASILDPAMQATDSVLKSSLLP